MHKRIVHDAKEMAGCFYDHDRSEAFRRTFPSQDEYVALKWPHFVAGVRAAYAELLSHAGVSEDEKAAMYEALTDNASAVMSEGASSPMQIIKDSSAFFGDRRENLRTSETYGTHGRSVKDALRSTTALLSTHH